MGLGKVEIDNNVHLGPALLTAEGHTNTRALAQGMRRHDAYHQNHFASISSSQGLELHVLILLQVPLSHPDEERPYM